MQEAINCLAKAPIFADQNNIVIYVGSIIRTRRCFPDVFMLL